MAIIKCHNAQTLLKDALVLDLGDVVHQAKRIRELSEAKARSLLANAQRDAEAIRKQVRDESAKTGFEEGFAKGQEEGQKQGHEEGYQAALNEAKQQLHQLEQAWINAAHKWDNERTAMERDARQAVLELTLRLTEKVVHRIVQVDEQVINDQLAAVLSYVLRPMDVTVRICPDDRSVLEKAMPQLLNEFNLVQQIHLLDDTSVARGGCDVTYGQGRIDANLEKQLDRLVEVMVPNRDQLASQIKSLDLHEVDTASDQHHENQGDSSQSDHSSEVI